MKKFVTNIVSFGFLIFVFSYAYDYVVTEGLKKCEYGQLNDWNKILNGSINSDIVINGSSKARVQVLPEILDSFLDYNSYNLGIHAYGFNMQKVKFDAYALKNKYPKALIQIVSNKTMQKRDDLYEMYQFLPYLDNEFINKGTREYVGLKPTDYFIPSKRYFGKYYLQYIGVISYFNLPFSYLKDSKTNGAIGLERLWDGSFDEFKLKNPNGVNYRIDKSLDIKFKSFLNNLEKNNVIVFFSIPTNL